MIPETIPVPLFFNLIVPKQGYGGQRVKFYGATFSPTVDYYAKFGELEPTPIIYRNPGLLEGEVPERDKIGPVSVSIVTEAGNLVCYVMRRFDYICRDCKNAEEGIKWACDKVDLEDVFRDAKDTTRDSPPLRGPSTQARRHGAASDDEAGAQDGVDNSKPVDTLMQVLTNKNENGNFGPALFPPSRSWTDAPAVTTTMIVDTATTASLKVIKANSRKPTSKAIVSRWLMSDYGSRNSQTRKRTRADMERDETAGQSGVGRSPVGSINPVVTPEQGKPTEENLPAVLMDTRHDDPQAARTLKRRKVVATLPPLSALKLYDGANDGDLID